MSFTISRIATVALLIPAAVMLTGCQERAEPVVPPATPAAGEPALETDASSAEQARVDALLQEYLELRQLLADDQMEGVPEAFAAVSNQAQPLTESDSAPLQSIGQTLVDSASAEPQDLEQAREAFEGVSTAMIDLVKIVPPSSAVAETLYVAHCPMVEADWLQKGEELVNPYMGKKMLACGEVVEAIETE